MQHTPRRTSQTCRAAYPRSCVTGACCTAVPRPCSAVPPCEDDMNLVYVAASRAQRCLLLNQDLSAWLTQPPPGSTTLLPRDEQRLRRAARGAADADGAGADAAAAAVQGPAPAQAAAAAAGQQPAAAQGQQGGGLEEAGAGEGFAASCSAARSGAGIVSGAFMPPAVVSVPALLRCLPSFRTPLPMRPQASSLPAPTAGPSSSQPGRRRQTCGAMGCRCAGPVRRAPCMPKLLKLGRSLSSLEETSAVGS
jgi:hypothetical protein